MNVKYTTEISIVWEGIKCRKNVLRSLLDLGSSKNTNLD